ncbi:MAG: DUF4340 domain-containing protein [Bacteriovoracaceae bacterium]|jgi:hypothetical protein|nr:DUF4340 domain-containing protein [Bacteriovoracaceae bacterium]
MTTDPYHKITKASFIVFTLLLTLAAFYTEFLRAQKKTNLHNVDLKTKLFNSLKISTIEKITLKNQFGSIKMIHNNDESWSITEPIKINAKTSQIKLLIASINNIQLKTVHAKDRLNIQNFNIEESKNRVDITTNDGKTNSIIFGLSNPLTQSSFISISKQNVIYETHLINNIISKINIKNLVDNRSFQLSVNKIHRVDIFNGYTNTTHTLIKKNNTWKSNKYKVIDSLSAQKEIQTLMSIKVHKLFNKEKEINNPLLMLYLKNPRYKLKLYMPNKTKTYIISNLMKKNESLAIKNKNGFIIKDSARDEIMFIKKENLNKFNINYTKLKKRTN